MKWVLVYIIVGTLGEPSAVNAMGPKYFFDTMHDCFWMREEVANKLGGKDGYFPPGKQAICVPVEMPST
tara:strand:+ start:1748 stop:1954 length:207 start_codon:yes stop_codon:yes gene_type:complete